MLHKTNLRLRTTVRKKICHQIDKHLAQSNVNYPVLSIMRKSVDKKISCTFRFFWAITLILSIVMCITLMYDRFSHYLSEPSIVNIETTEQNVVPFPTIVLCGRTSPKITELARRLNVLDIYSSVSVYCMDPVGAVCDDNNITAAELWSWLNVSDTIQSIHTIEKPSENLKEKLTHRNLVTGMCAQFSYGKTKLFNPKMQVVVKFDEEKFVNSCSIPPTKYILLEEETAAPFPYNDWSLPTSYTVQSIATIQKYVFLNKTTRPCTTAEEYQLCEQQCNIDNTAEKPTCRFPFMSYGSELPECYNSFCNDYYKSVDVYFAQWKSNSSTTCKCFPPCERQMISNQQEIQQNSGFKLTVKVVDAIRTATEEPAYGLISFFCDLGGNIGLCLGISCLMMVEILIVLTNFVIQWFKPKLSSRDALVVNRVKKCMKKYSEDSKKNFVNSFHQTGLQHILGKKKGTTSKKILWLFLVVFATFVCCYQIYDRIVYYFLYSKSISIAMVEIEDIEFPVGVLCSDSAKLTHMKKKFMEKNKISENCTHKFDMLNMIDGKTSVELLWKYSRLGLQFSRTPNLKISKNTAVEINITMVSTVFGFCQKVIPVTARYYLSLYGYSVMALKDGDCQRLIKISLITPGNDFSLKTIIFIEYPGIYQITYLMQKIIKLNTPTSQCVDKKEYIDCVRLCLDKKMNSTFHCNLPFLNSTIKMCKDAASALEFREQYLNITLKTDPLKDCGCLKPCNDLIYYPNIKILTDYKSPVNLLIVRPFHNFQEVIKESLSFPFVKLLCDIGSNMGVVLGMSVISFLHDALHIFKC